MAKATVGTALHYLSQHTELDSRTERGSQGEKKLPGKQEIWSLDKGQTFAV